ncbi:MAG: methyltransferase domain-containing protein [Halofilum sp. (in: g-proteobacteria)]
MTGHYDDAVQTAREYYNSEDADNFYYHIWGGEDLHIGLYKSDSESIRDASERTCHHMMDMLKNIDENSYVLDVGAGYGGSMRHLARRFGCKSVALNLSEAENERDREKNKEQGFDHLIKVVDGDFTQVPYADETFDLVWSQDAFLHSGNREQVFAEAVRVLKPGGELLFTDPMQADDANTQELQPIYDRLHLESLGSPGFYREQAKKHGLTELGFEDLTHQLTNHYGRVRQELVDREDELKKEDIVGEEYIERMKEGLAHWVNGGKGGQLAWGIFHFRK